MNDRMHADQRMRPAGKGGCTSPSKRRDGELCNGPAITGTDKCRMHAGKSLAKAKAEGAIRTQLLQWVEGTPLVDPGEQYLRLITQSAHRAQQLSAELELIVDTAGSLEKALTANTYVATEDGGTVKTGEYVRALAQLEMAERKFCADMCAKAITAGIAERQVRVAEQAGAVLVDVIRAVLGRLGVAEDPRVPSIVATCVREITGSAA